VQIFDGYPVQFQCGRCGATPTTAPSSEFKLTTESVLVVVCGGCNLPTMIRASAHRATITRPDGMSDQYRDPLEQIPQPTIESFDAGVVPEPIARRYADAQRARNAGLWEQAIGTSRTAVQTMCRLEDVKRGRLVDEIDRLLEKKGSELPGLVKTMAHRIRDAGNDALHPDDPAWTPTREEADEAIQFLKAILEWLYAMPARLRLAEGAVGDGRDNQEATVVPPETLE
jgi:hypothetical protein